MRKLAMMVVLISANVFGQGVFYNSNVTTAAKNVPSGAQAPVYTLPYAKVTVCGYPSVGTDVCTNVTPVYSDQALTHVIPQPLVADSEGRFQFWIDPSLHSYSIQTPAGKFVGTWPLSLNSQVGPQGPGGVGCGAANCIISAPTVTQTITQQGNTNLNVITSGTGQFQSNGAQVLTSSLGVSKTASSDQVITQTGSSLRTNRFNDVLYADQCAGDDIGAKINSCVALLPSVSGYQVGTIVLPNTSAVGSMRAWHTTAHIGPGVNIQGQGVLASAFDCDAAICLQGDASASSGQYAHTTGVSQSWQGFTITGNNRVNQTIIQLLDEQNLILRDIAADGAGKTGGTCIELRDVNWYTERNTFMSVSTLLSCKVGWRFTTNTLNPFQPHPSFGYNRFLDIKININNGSDGTGQTGISIEGSSFIYNCTFRMTINSDSSPSTMIHMEGTSEFFENELHMFGEGPTTWVLDISASTNVFTYIGQIDVAPQNNNFASGSAITHWIDDGGFGPALVGQFFNKVYLNSGVENAVGMQIASVAGCTVTAGATLTPCVATVSLSPVQPDGNYTVIGCQVELAVAGNMLAGPVRGKTTSTFQIFEYSADAATTGGGTLKCLVVRN